RVTKHFRATRTRTHRAALFTRTFCPRLCEVAPRGCAHSGRIGRFERAPKFWPLEPEQSRARAFGRRRGRYFSAEKRPHLGPHFSLCVFLQADRPAVHAAAGPLSRTEYSPNDLLPRFRRTTDEGPVLGASSWKISRAGARAGSGARHSSGSRSAGRVRIALHAIGPSDARNPAGIETEEYRRSLARSALRH